MLFRVFIYFLLQTHNSNYESQTSDLRKCEEETIAIVAVVPPKQIRGVYLARDHKTLA